jgi:membrane fusion protein, adhesin transport system
MTSAPPNPTEPSEKVSLTTHSTFWLCALMVIAFSFWASLSTLDIVSMATGEVIPSTQVKTIQHLEGGIVSEILVSEGQKVGKNQSLIVLEPTASGADVAELRVRLTSLETDIAQLDGLARGLDEPEFSERLIKEYPALIMQAQRRFVTRKKRHQNELKKQEQAVIQRRQEIREISTRINGSSKSLKLVNEQIKISEELLKDNLTNRFRHLDLLKEARRLKSSANTDRAGLERAKSALNESQAELESMRSTFDDEVQKSLEEARLNHGELNQRVKKFEDSLKRTTVRSPEAGVIKTLHVVTVGGVVRPGDPVADIVPAGDRLIIEAKLPTQDIGYVAVGQDAVVKLASADAMRFGSLNGSVVNVSPDTLITPEGMPFYKVRVEMEKAYFENGKLRYELFPGMQVMTSIQTGERTVMQYILDPIMYRLGDAFQER